MLENSFRIWSDIESDTSLGTEKLTIYVIDPNLLEEKLESG